MRTDQSIFKRSLVRSFVLLSILILLVYESIAQDTHYWAESYGNRSTVLSGAVIGSVEDLGCVYYNPGMLSLLENPAFVLSAKAYEISSIKVNDIFNTGEYLYDNNLGASPGFFAGTVRFKKIPDHKFGYSFLTRSSIDAELVTRAETRNDAIPGNGLETLYGENNLRTKNRDDWLGVTYSYSGNNKIGIGVSMFGSTNSQRANYNLFVEALSDSGTLAVLEARRDIRLRSNSLLWKVGLAANFEPFHFGLTVTTPKWNLFGSGSYFYENVVTGVDYDMDGIDDNVLDRSNQEDLNARFKSPWAIGTGVGVKLNKINVHFTVEWYNKLNSYSSLDINSFTGLVSGDTITTSLVDIRNHVVNAGIGFEFNPKEYLSFNLSFATDFSSVNNKSYLLSKFGEELTNSIFVSNNYNVGAGGTVNVKDVEITIGGAFYFGSQKIPWPEDIDINNFPVFEDSVNAKFNRWRFYFGFSLPFFKDTKANI